MSNPKRPVSTVEEFIKVFHEMSARYGHSELWYDYIDYDLDDGDRIMVDDSLYDDALDAFDEYDIEYEEV